MNKKLLIAGSLLGGIAIVLGAFGAHGLKTLISLESQQTFETGVRYQMYHAILLLVLGSASVLPHKAQKRVLYLVVLGVFFFSGSIYGLATNDLSSFDFKAFAFITPVGGLLLILAWAVLLINFLKIASDKS